MVSYEYIDTAVVVRVSASRFDAALGLKIKEEVQARLAKDKRYLLDLSAVKLVDSGGLGHLVAVLKLVLAQQGRLGLVGLQTPVRMMFELSRMDRQFSIFKTLDDGLTALT